MLVWTPPSALPPPGDCFIQAGLLGGGELPGPVIDALRVQPYAKSPFFQVIGLTVPGQLVPRRQPRDHLCQAPVPPGCIVSLLSGPVPPSRYLIEGGLIGGGEGAAVGGRALAFQPAG